MAADLLARVARLLVDVSHEVVTTLCDPAGRARLMAGAGRVPAADSGTLDAPDAARSLAALRDRLDGAQPNAFEILVDFADAMTSVIAFVQQVAQLESADDAWNLWAGWLDLIAIDRLRVDHLEVVAALKAFHLLSDNRLLVGDLVRARGQWGSFVLGHPPDEASRADNLALLVGAVIAVLGKWVPPQDEQGKTWRIDMLFGWDADPRSPTPRAERALQRMATVHFTHADPLGGATTLEERLGFSVAVVPGSQGGGGLFLALELGGGLKFKIGPHLALSLKADAPAGVHAFFGRNAFVRSGAGKTQASLMLARRAEAAEVLTVGPEGRVHFEVGRFATGLELADPMRLRFTLGDAALVLPRESLGFLGSVLPSGGVRFKVDIDMTLDTEGRLSLSGGAGLSATLPVNAAVSVLRVRSLTLSLSVEETDKGPAAALGAVVAFGLDFGKPFKVTVDGIGARLLWTLPASPRQDSPTPAVRGNLGSAGDLGLDFVPPKGIGVVIDTALVHGGGYLYLDPARRTYAGVLEASLKLGTLGVQLKAAALLRETDEGWDFVLVLSAEFTPALEIFLGLTLNGVGGLVGINVAVDVDRLRAGLRDGAVGRLLFPQDPVANAPAIIATLSSVFPHRQGGLVVGPMLQLGWGRPVSFVTMSVAVVIAAPSPTLLMILGRLRIAAPHPDLAVADLKADFLGVLDFEAPAVSFDASLVDSRLTMFPVTGDMAMRAGADGFVLAIGGLHPRFPTPAALGTMRRITLDISPNPITKIRCEAYLAVTSNTFQIGLSARMDVDARVFTIHGWLNFDALVQWEPRFQFVIELSAGMELRVGGRCLAGVSVALLLQGPGPWHARGRASIHLLFFTIRGGFEVTWGDAPAQLPPPEVDAFERVAHALSVPGGWRGVPPEGPAVATFRDRGDEASLRVHPDGRVSVRQQAVPLGIPVTRIGQSRVAGGTATVVVAPAAGGPPALPTQGQFAPSQFMDLSDDERLSRPSFESFGDGISFGSEALLVSSDQRTPGAYETVFIPERRPRVRGVLHASLLDQALHTNAVARSGLHTARLHDGPRPTVQVLPPRWQVAQADSLVAATGAAAAAGVAVAHDSAAAAHAAAASLAARLGSGRVQVVDAHELAEA